MGTKKSQVQDGSPVLDVILSGNSTVCLNIAEVHRRRGETFFMSRALQTSVIFKYPHDSDSDSDDDGGLPQSFYEEEYKAGGAGVGRPVRSGIYFPYDSRQLAGGGQAVFLNEQNFVQYLEEILGIGEKLGEQSGRDLAILQTMASLPSLDTFLLKEELQHQFPDINASAFDMSPEDVKKTRARIQARIMPILTKAAGQLSRHDAERTLNALWNPDMPEAAMFISSFGLDVDQAPVIFNALRGISYYEALAIEMTTDIKRFLKWHADPQFRPTDWRSHPSFHAQFLTLASSVDKSVRVLLKHANELFQNYDASHREFLEKSNPMPFRKALATSGRLYGEMGAAICKLSLIGYTFRSALNGGRGGKLFFQRHEELLRRIWQIAL